jgi:hypothetical protein
VALDFVHGQVCFLREVRQSTRHTRRTLGDDFVVAFAVGFANCGAV